VPGRRPDAQLARRCGRRIGEDEGALLGQPERRLGATAAVVQGDEATRKLAAQLDRFELGVRDVVSPEQERTERAGAVAAREQVDIPDVIRLEDNEETRWTRVEPVPCLVRVVGRRERIE